MSSAEVLTILASQHGGFCGDVPGKQIGVQIVSDTEATYTLTVWENDSPTSVVERYRLTLEPVADGPPPPPDSEAQAIAPAPTDPEAVPDGAASPVSEGEPA